MFPAGPGDGRTGKRASQPPQSTSPWGSRLLQLAAAMDVTKPYKFIGFGAMDATKPYKFIGSGAMEVTKAYKFIGSGAMEVTKPYKFIGSGAMEVTKPYKFIGFGFPRLVCQRSCGGFPPLGRPERQLCASWYARQRLYDRTHRR